MTLNATNRISAKDLVYVFYDDGEAKLWLSIIEQCSCLNAMWNLDRLDNMHNYPNLFSKHIRFKRRI